MRVALIASEAVPLAKTGGLADVIGGLSRALAQLGAELLVVLPRYRAVAADALRPVGLDLPLTGGDQRFEAAVLEGRMPGGVRAYLLDVPRLYDRPGLYGEVGRDYSDNCLRFSIFCRGALELLRRLQLRCDVVHVHDWQAGLVPLYLKSIHADDAFFDGTRSLLTIHNLAYQGLFPPEDLPATGLDAGWLTPRYLEYFGRLNLLKGAIVSADAITTVSPTYAREILAPEHGCGLEGVLRDRADDLVGILNGIDTKVWDPAIDPQLPAHYGPDSLAAKGRCKAALQRRLGLSPGGTHPLFVVISRLAHQKGIDLLVDAFPAALEQGAQWAILGAGDAELEAELEQLARRFAGRVAVRTEFDEGLAHLMQAGADFLAMPSRFEPCGLNQMYALRYGTVPVVRSVGGLVDTVLDIGADAAEGTGIVFVEASAEALLEGLTRARGVWRRPGDWTALRRRGMCQDFSWQGSARRYLELYEGLLGSPRRDIPVGPGAG